MEQVGGMLIGDRALPGMKIHGFLDMLPPVRINKDYRANCIQMIQA